MKRTILTSILASMLLAWSLHAQAVLESSRPAEASRPAQGEPSNTPLTGTWALVAVDNILADGRRIQPYGPRPEGRLMLDASGRYSVQIFRPGRAQFAANDKRKGTPEENHATVQGTNSHFGRYSVNEAERILAFAIEHASFPNWEGTEQRRSYVLEGDELKYTVRTTTTGGSEIGEVTWRRLP